jgi:hypothetical protein
MALDDLERIGHSVAMNEDGEPEDHYNHFWEHSELKWTDFNEYMDAPQQVKEWAAQDYKCSF